MLTLVSCSLARNEKFENKQNPIEIKENTPNNKILEIFSIPNIQMNQEIHTILMSDMESYYKFMNSATGFILFCDTLDGKITEIKPMINNDPGKYERLLIDYFTSFSKISCATYPNSGKVSQYKLLIWLEPDTLNFNVDYGYEDR